MLLLKYQICHGVTMPFRSTVCRPGLRVEAQPEAGEGDRKIVDLLLNLQSETGNPACRTHS